ncbi:MAG TPA: phosphatase PAP2 family protein [Terracidiphilus sp.]|jgi:membrane-associated phospholipid phosphatase|nr:phosphatase PAP2 family protein [Terracidiphilus sp.]
MSKTLSKNPSEETVPSREAANGTTGSLAFHAWMAGTAVAVLLVSVFGCWLTQVHVPEVGGRILAAFIVTAAFQAVPLYWHRKGRIALRESSLTVLWAAVLWIALPFHVDVAARLGRAFPLRDPVFARIDAHLGMNVAALAQWARLHWVGRAVNACYALLLLLLVLAFLLPGLSGKATAVKRLLVGNLVAFAVGLPFFACLPAVGPWYGEHFAPNRIQVSCQTEVMSLRAPGPYEHRPAGVICFPSFHVMWAILCAAALASFRRLRWPAWIVAALVVASTMTTGWHYFSDVLGGIALAAVSLAAARWMVRE